MKEIIENIFSRLPKKELATLLNYKPATPEQAEIFGEAIGLMCKLAISLIGKEGIVATQKPTTNSSPVDEFRKIYQEISDNMVQCSYYQIFGTEAENKAASECIKELALASAKVNNSIAILEGDKNGV